MEWLQFSCTFGRIFGHIFRLKTDKNIKIFSTILLIFGLLAQVERISIFRMTFELHSKGRSPVCDRLCLVICEDDLNSEPQISHFLERSSRCIFLCILYEAEWMNRCEL